MFVVSRKCRYGVEAVLALADHYDQGLLQIKDIVAGGQIPRQYLEQIFNRLVKAGLVRSVRGKKGGYSLALPPDKVSVLMVVETLEGGIEVPLGEVVKGDAIAELFDRGAVGLRTILAMSFADLGARQQELRKNMMYFI